MSYGPVLVGALLLAVLGWAFAVGDAGSAIAFLTTDPWGIATLADFYAGLLCFGFVVHRIERSAGRTLAWLLPSFALGNLVPALYLALYLVRIGSPHERVA